MATQIWKSLPPVLGAVAAAEASVPVFGFSAAPQVKNQGDYAEILLTSEQEDLVAAFIIRQLEADPGPIRVNLAGVMLKVVTRKYWGYFAGLAGISFLAGRTSKRRR